MGKTAFTLPRIPDDIHLQLARAPALAFFAGSLAGGSACQSDGGMNGQATVAARVESSSSGSIGLVK